MASIAVPHCRSKRLLPDLRAARWAMAALLFGGAQALAAAVPLYDSVGLNIGLNCRWERRCMDAQSRAMNRALGYVRAKRPPQRLIHLCNRNATRGRSRVDWIGFDNCIRHAR